jgi:CubicO group peptidase (beta-lactamase class C family)
MSDDLRETVGGAIAEAIGAGLTPGAVVLIARGDEILCHEAVGDRSLVPERLPVEPDTVFDVASLTKVVATTTVVMQLAEGGALSLDDELRRWLPEFTGEARDRVTIRDLLAHCSGLPAHRRLGDSLGEDVAEDDRRERATAAICRLPLEHAPGEGVIYSCLGFILLTTVVQVASGRRLEDLACERVFGPLGMADTGFCPPPAARARCAATEQLPDGTLIGVVHDENAPATSAVSEGTPGSSPPRPTSRGSVARCCTVARSMGYASLARRRCGRCSVSRRSAARSDAAWAGGWPTPAIRSRTERRPWRASGTRASPVPPCGSTGTADCS